MSQNITSAGSLPAIGTTLCLLAAPLLAAPVFEEVSSPTQFSYTPDVTASDLLQGLTPVTNGWNTGNEASPIELTDGIHGVGFGEVPGDRVQGAWTTVGATAEYELGTGTNGAGYDLTSIQSIADWVNVGFGNQVWTVEVKPMGGDYATLATIDYQDLGTGNIIIRDLDTPSQTVIPVGDAQVSVSGAELTIDPTNNLAASTNYAVRVDSGAITDLSGNHFSGIADDTTWNFTTGVPDLTAPAIVSTDPADDSSDVPLASDMVVTFDEDIAIGSGTITIKDLDTPSETVITLPDPRISVSGAILMIQPTANLAITTNHAGLIGATAITDLSGNPFAGIADDTTWSFVTADEPLRIMCLGDSITVDYTDNPTWANHPFMFGYRSGLFTRLHNAGYNFLVPDSVGTTTTVTVTASQPIELLFLRAGVAQN